MEVFQNILLPDSILIEFLHVNLQNSVSGHLVIENCSELFWVLSYRLKNLKKLNFTVLVVLLDWVLYWNYWFFKFFIIIFTQLYLRNLNVQRILVLFLNIPQRKLKFRHMDSNRLLQFDIFIFPWEVFSFFDKDLRQV